MDARVQFIYQQLQRLKAELGDCQSDILIRRGRPEKVFQDLFRRHRVGAIYLNRDYEPGARRRDEAIEKICFRNRIEFRSFKDQCLFEKDEILNGAGKPYTVFTPYKRKVLSRLSGSLTPYPTLKFKKNFLKTPRPEKMPSLESLGFKSFPVQYPPARVSSAQLKRYEVDRDYPARRGGTRLGVHLRFGTLSVRDLARRGKKHSATWLSELIWRDFFMQILWHFPEVEKKSFRAQYDRIAWRRSQSDFRRWSEGVTGYPLVDAGMRELNQTGYMHNRARMVTASFLTKHLLIHWYRGERYFAEKLLDYDLSSNNGNWQWAAGSGCDAAPYFRIFNPQVQARKFDPDEEYIKKWIPEYGTRHYPAPMISHEEARMRCLMAYADALKG